MAYISIPTYWKSLPQRYKLIGRKCVECGKILFPPRNFCDACGGKNFSDFRLSGEGEVITNTIIARGAAPPEFIDLQKKTGSFAVVIVKLSEGPTIIAQMTDCNPNDVAIGMKVESVIRKIYEQEGVIRYGFKFRPKRS